MGILARLIGARAERRAARTLRRRGYRIIERNVLSGPGEIDLVTVKGRVVVFVEVRARQTAMVDALASFDVRKRRVLAAAVRAYKTRERLWGAETRIDLIAICGRRIEHVRDALDESAPS